MEMQFHEAANIFPLDDDNIASLADDIRTNKQQVAIELLDGKVLDGRRRWLACKMAGVKPLTRTVAVADPVAYVLSLNLHRRHLSPTQLAMVGARAREMYDEAAKERMQRGKKSDPVENLPQGTARDAVGKAVGVSGKSIDHATKVLRHGSEKLIAAVDSDLISVSTASRATSNSEREQDALVERTKRAEANGHSKRPRPAAGDAPDKDDESGEVRGVGVIRANEAINCLTRIPKNDALRKRGFQLVTDWIRHNK